MRTFPAKFIYAGWCLAASAFLSALAGTLSLWFLILSLICLTALLLLMWKSFRCPYCGGFINLDHMTRAMHQPYFCFHCGKQIKVSGNGKTGEK